MSRRTRQRIVGPEINLLWNFHPAHIRDGPADGFPINILATPRNVPGTSDHEYFVHLVEGFRTTFEVLIQSYISRHGYQHLNRAQILDLPIFLFPTETTGLGESITVSQGNMTLRTLNTESIETIYAMSQSNTIRDVMDLTWTLVFNPISTLRRLVRGRAAEEIPKWLGKG